jgi:hypothetical protein
MQATTTLRSVRVETAQLDEQVREVMNRNRAEDGVQLSTLERLVSDEKEFKEISRKIHIFEQGGDSVGKLREVEANSRKLQTKIEDHEQQLKDREDQRRMYDANMSGPQDALKNIRCNRLFNKENQKWKELGMNIRDLEQQIREILNSETLDEVRNIRTKLNEEERNMTSTISRYQGEKGVLERESQRLTQEIRDSNLTDVDERHRAKVIEFKVCEAIQPSTNHQPKDGLIEQE